MSDDQSSEIDTPVLPHTEYHVHDPERPNPTVVDPGVPGTPEQHGSPPSDATVLFDGSDLSAWEGVEGDDPGWTVEDGYVEVEPGAGDIQTREGIGDCHLHVEWAAPEEAGDDGQGSGNSGVFLMGRYEIQVLNNHENETYADGEAGAVYGQQPPAVNPAREPGEWQTYDVLWQGPRFDGEELVRPATVTLLHNGVVTHFDYELIGPTTWRDVSDYEPHPPEAPLQLQDHGDRVRFTNIWYRPLP